MKPRDLAAHARIQTAHAQRCREKSSYFTIIDITLDRSLANVFR
jgi:hypothetical protein